MYISVLYEGFLAKAILCRCYSLIREVAKEKLPRGYDIAWEGLRNDESQRGNEALYIF